MAGYIGSKSSVTQVDGYNRTEADAEFVNDPNAVITVSGSNVGIGTSSPAANHALEISGNQKYLAVTANAGGGGPANPSSSSGLFLGWNQSNGGGESNIVYGTGLGSSPALQFSSWNGTTYTERARIDSSGVVMVSRTSAYGDGAIGTPTFQCGGVAGTRAGMACIQDSTAAVGAIAFVNPNGNVGNISTSGTSTTYATSSDYRLKENVVPLAGAADRLAQIPVHRFNFIADPDTTVDGFLAHEVQAVIPEAVTGEKDAVDADGNPVHQGIDQSKLVPLLTAALQEALQKIDALEARIVTLEGGAA